MQLRPTENFVIARQVDDPYDTATYYVQAKVRNAQDDTLLKTVNLTDNGDQRFRGDYEVPVDGSGLGFYITITTRVYTDSGYTTESENYGVEEREYLVQERYNQNIGGPGGGGSDISYEKIKKIVKEVVDGRKLSKQKDVDLTKVLEAISNIEGLVGGIVIPEPEKVDLEPTMANLVKLEARLDALLPLFDGINTNINNIPQPKQVDMTGVEKAVQGTKPYIEQVDTKLEKIVSKVQSFVTQDIEKILKAIESLDKRGNDIPYLIENKGTPKQTKEVKKTRRLR